MATIPYADLDPLHFTLDQYHELGEAGMFDEMRVELLYGVLSEKDVRSAEHDDAIAWLNEVLVKGVPDELQVRFTLTDVSTQSEPEPDLAVFERGSDRPYHYARAPLVVEVSNTSLRKDRLVKTRIYATAGCAEYWIVNLRERVVEVHTDPRPDHYAARRVAGAGQRLTPTAFDGPTIDVAELFDKAFPEGGPRQRPW